MISYNKFGWTNENKNSLIYYKKRREKTIEICLEYKEELMMANWHPDRPGFITWCFDIEDCKEMLD